MMSEAVRRFIPLLDEVAQDFCHMMQTKVEREGRGERGKRSLTINPSPDLFRFALEASCHVLYGERIGLFSPPLLWSHRSLSGQWSECWPPRPLSSTCPTACCSTWEPLCGPSTPAPGTTSSLTVRCSFRRRSIESFESAAAILSRSSNSGGEDPEGVPAAVTLPESRS
ncbi:hypothetical protein fugu_010207 [Takifugu bimaculatus]|uniref:Uncharacterized protein n=1 Tax=Takifugu bimaculatus TaxID=433685 RepID=A0A4Z2CF06_9TELE|nr:hypothetical protein fugu_010207 [Takifugu bimaculatus]